MMQFVEHITRDRERWDTLAYEYYANPYKYEGIIAANLAIALEPDGGIIPTLPSGLRLLIPIVEDEVVINPNLPPWLQ